MNRKVLLGADPELFARDRATGALVSAHNLIPGTKLEPHPVNLGAVQVDGTALEFNIDAASTEEEFVTNINSVLQQLEHMIPQNLMFAFEPAVHYPPEYFATVPESAKELGCNPDYNAWTLMPNPSPDTSISPTLRTASGHVHIGWNLPDEQLSADEQAAVIRQMDYFLGLPSMLWDPDPERRQLYGKAGAFRPKAYGAEYRVMSNAWLRSTATMREVYQRTMMGMQEFFRGNQLCERYGDLAVDIIDNNNTNWVAEYPELAKELKVA